MSLDLKLYGFLSGPSQRKGRLISAVAAEDNSIFAVSAASRSLCTAILSVKTSIPF